MKPLIRKLILLTLVFISYINGVTGQIQDENLKPEERTYTYQERELEYLMTIWPGEYDNIEQLDFDKALKKTKAENGGHVRVHSFIKHIDLPDFGEYVLYLEEYKDDNPNLLSRQSIYQLMPDEKANTIRMKVYHFKELNPILSLNNKLDFLKKISLDSSLLIKGCDILIQRSGMAFTGYTENINCVSDTINPKLTIDYQIRVTDKDYWFSEIKYDTTTNNKLADNLQPTPYQLEKSRCFVCMIDFPNDKNGRPTITKYYINIHDQGGKFEFYYPEGRHMVLGMRNTWSFGMQRETFVIFIQEGSQKGPTLIYSWAEPGTDRIGFNPGWIRVQCDLNTPKNAKLQHGLRPGS